MTDAEIFARMQEILENTFEIPREDVVPQALLFQDLDLDSIDAVDLIVKLQELTGKKIDPQTFKQVRTVQDVVDAVKALLSGEGGSPE